MGKNLDIHIFRSISLEVHCKKGVLRNFSKFTGKHLCQSLFFIKLACNFIKKETLAQVFSCEFCKISKNIFFHTTPPVAASDTEIVQNEISILKLIVNLTSNFSVMLI